LFNLKEIIEKKIIDILQTRVLIDFNKNVNKPLVDSIQNQGQNQNPDQNQDQTPQQYRAQNILRRANNLKIVRMLKIIIKNIDLICPKITEIIAQGGKRKSRRNRKNKSKPKKTPNKYPKKTIKNKSRKPSRKSKRRH
jgi:hypothetical protein